MELIFETSGIRLVGDVVGVGPEVILLHAGGERRQVWRPVARELAAAGFAAVAPDQRGHGQSGGSRNDSIDAFATDVHALMTARGGRPVVVGASLGGFAAMLALGSARGQDRAAALVLIDVVPDPDPERVRAYLDAPPRRMGSLPLVSEILSRAADFRQAVSRLTIPVMLVCGGRSAITASDAQRLRRIVPQLLVSIVPNAGHLVAREAAAELSAVLISFLSTAAVRDRHAMRNSEACEDLLQYREEGS